VFADAGFDDLFVAYPVVGEDKGRRLVALGDRVRLAVGVDSVEGAVTLARPFREAGRSLDVLLKVDVGYGRVGVTPDRAVAVGHAVAELPGLHAAVRAALREELGGYPGLSEHDDERFVVAPALGGRAVVVARVSEADERGRHRGVSHHTRAALRLCLGSREIVQVRLAPTPQGNSFLYFILASVGIFTLMVGAWVRLRRPGDQSSLHLFWLTVAFFGVFTFSFSGRFDRLDWVFYWADMVALLALAPMLLHFTLVFPERGNKWVRTPVGARLLPLLYLPALIMGSARVMAVAMTLVACALLAWIIRRLMSPLVRQEFA